MTPMDITLKSSFVGGFHVGEQVKFHVTDDEAPLAYTVCGLVTGETDAGLVQVVEVYASGPYGYSKAKAGHVWSVGLKELERSSLDPDAVYGDW